MIYIRQLWLTGRWRWWPSQRSWIDCEVSESDSVDGSRCPMGRHPSEQSPPKSAARHLGTHPTTATDNASGRSTPSGSSQLANISCTNLQLGSTKIKKINFHHHHNSTSVTVTSHTSICTEYSLSPFITVYYSLCKLLTLSLCKDNECTYLTQKEFMLIQENSKDAVYTHARCKLM